MRKAALFLLLHSFAVSVAVAQISVGVIPNTLNSSDANFPTPQTDVSLENPATGSGSIDTGSGGDKRTRRFLFLVGRSNAVPLSR